MTEIKVGDLVYHDQHHSERLRYGVIQRITSTPSPYAQAYAHWRFSIEEALSAPVNSAVNQTCIEVRFCVHENITPHEELWE